MATYRYQVVSVGMWRGKIKRWNTTVHRNDVTYVDDLHNLMQLSGYANPGDAEGACSGGVASISVYPVAGGPPISETTYFDWQTPTEWIPYATGSGSPWSSIPSGTPLDASGESALIVWGVMSGLSSTGKPVTVRKYLHAIPSRTAADYADPDVSSTVVAAFEALWTTNWLTGPHGYGPVSSQCDEWYGNHQRVRGRRRSVKSVAAQSFSNGVVLGSGAKSGGGFGGSFGSSSPSYVQQPTPDPVFLP